MMNFFGLMRVVRNDAKGYLWRKFVQLSNYRGQNRLVTHIPILVISGNKYLGGGSAHLIQFARLIFVRYCTIIIVAVAENGIKASMLGHRKREFARKIAERDGK